MPAEELGPLPAGRHGYSREQVAHHQRERLIAGLAAAVAEKGYAAVTLSDIVRHAKVSRRVFYANFESKEQCFLAAFEVVVDHLRELVAEAAAPEPDWPHRAIAATRAALAFLAAEPDLARLCLVESRSAGPAVTARFAAAVGELAPALRQGRAERPEGERLPASTEDSTSAPWSPWPTARSPPEKPPNSRTSSPTAPSSSSCPTSGPSRPPASCQFRHRADSKDFACAHHLRDELS